MPGPDTQLHVFVSRGIINRALGLEAAVIKIYSVDAVNFHNVQRDAEITIIAEGQVNTGGWGEAKLVKTDPQPTDGYAHFDLVSQPPDPTMVVTQGFQPRRASLNLSSRGLNGVTIHAATNEITKPYGQ